MNDRAVEDPYQWAGGRAERWVTMREGMDRQLAPVADLLFDAAALQSGERVLDVGCGTGATTRAAASAVGTGGAVTGVDISPQMLGTARAIPAPAASAPIEWLEADAGTWRPSATTHDVVISRFGVMFFSDPGTAFANLLALTAPGGRLHVAAWAERTLSPMFQLPMSIALDHRRTWGTPVDAPPADGGPFSLGDEAGVRRLLGEAGWKKISVEPRTVGLLIAGGGDADAAAHASLELGPAKIVTEDLDDERREQVRQAIAEAYQDHLDSQGHVVLEATPVIVSAHRSD